MKKDTTLIASLQGKTAFVKVKADWFNIDKLHLSFVRHNGDKTNCKQLAAIEAAMPMITGAENAMTFAEYILSGRMMQKAYETRRTAPQGAKYFNPIFTVMGGSPAKEGKPCRWRQVSLAPGMRTEFALSVIEADGETTNTGGFSMKKGAEMTRIDIGVTEGELVALAGNIKAFWTAELTRRAINTGIPELIPQEADEQYSAPAPTAALPGTVYAVYDSMGDEPMFVTPSVEVAIAGLKDYIKKVNASPAHFVLKEKDKFAAIENSIRNNTAKNGVVEMVADDGTYRCFVVQCGVPVK